MALLVNTGKWHAQQIVEVNVAATNESNLLRNSDVPFLEFLQRPKRQRVVETKDSIGSWFEIQQVSGCRCAAVLPVDIRHPPIDDHLFPHLHMVLQKCFLISLVSAIAGARLRPSNMGDVFAAYLYQVFRRKKANRRVVAANEVP